MRILAVDDDPRFLELLTASLHELGITEVTVVTSAAEALIMLKQQREQVFDVLLLDILMPEMDGVQLCRKVRKIPCCQQIPILMITAAQGRQWVFDAFDAGANDYVSKPLDRIELETRLFRLAANNDRADEAQIAGPVYASDVPLQSTIARIPSLLDSISMHNCVLQLSRFDLLFLGSLAITFPLMEAQRWSMTIDEFQPHLARCAELVRRALVCPNAMISYTEDGTFIVVAEFTRECRPIHIRKRLENLLATNPFKFATANSPGEFELMIGKRFTIMGAKAAYDALLDLEQAASIPFKASLQAS